MLLLPIPENLDELLQNGRLAAVALLRELCGVMVVAVDAAFVLIVRILRTKHCGTDRAREMLDMIFAVQRGNV